MNGVYQFEMEGQYIKYVIIMKLFYGVISTISYITNHIYNPYRLPIA
jgi:hypothetical protein